MLFYDESGIYKFDHMEKTAGGKIYILYEVEIGENDDIIITNKKRELTEKEFLRLKEL